MHESEVVFDACKFHARALVQKGGEGKEDAERKDDF
jgi:hypothetical protein